MNTCPACSKTVHPNDLLCPHCSIALHPGTATTAPATGSGMGLSVVVIVIVAVIGIILIVGCLGAARFFWFVAMPVAAPPPAPIVAPLPVPTYAAPADELKKVRESESTPATQPTTEQKTSDAATESP